ncbi:MAG: hypothetical protein QOK28_570 [Actinomycetota bacterium]|jgi:ketosteroid isomerase-like protein
MHEELADRLFKAIEAGDTDAVRDLYAPDAVIWHNNDGIEQTAEQNLRVLQWVVDNLRDRAYDDVRRHITPTGFVQQHVLRFTRADGTRQELPACIVVTCADGKITRLDEYLDSAHIARIIG